MQHIAIAGAGIGGLAAALALARPSRRVTIFEQTPVLGEVGAGLQLSPNACTALRSLGVLDDVEKDAVVLEDLRIRRARDGHMLARLPLGNAVRRRFGAPFLVTQRADLHRALRRRVEASATISLFTGASLAGWATSAAGLRLDFDDPMIASARADALIGADGLRSTVRAKLVKAPGMLLRRGTAWRSTIEAARVPAAFREPRSNLWLGAGAHLVHYPVASGRRINVVVAVDDAAPTSKPGEGWASPGDPHEIARRLSGWAAPAQRLVGAAETWNKWPLLDCAALPAWSEGVITLLGDAAHPMLPFLAQGTAQALEDAVALGRAVDSQPNDIETAFRAYEARRRSRTARVQAASRRQATIYHLSSPVSAIRDLVLRATPAGKLLKRYDWLYAYPSDPRELRND